jgi:hypothetical protein
MSVTPNDLWIHAKSLPEVTEAEKRVKISRCYYALYSHAFQFSERLSTEGLVLKNGSGMHKQLIQKLTNPTVNDPMLVKLSRQVGTQQMLAYDLRLKADYSLGYTVTASDVKKCVSFVNTGILIPLPERAAA